MIEHREASGKVVVFCMDATRNMDKEREKTQACHPERSEGSESSNDARVETADPSLRSG
jgi:hypothetical protein